MRFPLKLIHLGYLLFFLMLFVPTVYQPLKAVLLVTLMTLIGIGSLARGWFPVHPRIAGITLFFAAIGLFFVLRGVALGAPGAIRSGTVFVLWPLVYLILVSGVSSREDVAGLAKVLITSTIAIEIYMIDFLLHSNGWIPSFLYLDLDLGQSFASYSGFTEFTLFSMSSLLFLVPFSLAAFFIGGDRAPLPLASGWIRLSALLGVALTLLSGRRALVVAVAAAPLLAWFFTSGLPATLRRQARRVFRRRALFASFVLIAVYFALSLSFGLDLGSATGFFSSGFEFTTTPSSLVRQQQFGALVDAWRDDPWLGSGLGAVAPGPLRSIEFPWAYELSYLSLLFHVGLVGTMLYAAGIAWILRQAIRIIRSGDSEAQLTICIMVGMITFLIANGTNPYLEKFDYLWVIFLPVALINARALRRARPESVP